MLGKLHTRLTILCTLITCIILVVVTTGAFYIAREQRRQNSIASFKNDFNTIVYHVRTQLTIERAWLSQMEYSRQLIIRLEDNGLPFLFSGSWTTKTPRGDLISMARAKAQDLNFNFTAPPSSVFTADQIFFDLSGPNRERYHAAAASIPTSTRKWVGLILLKDLETEEDSAAREGRLFICLAATGTLLLAIFSWWFTGRAIRPVEDSRRRQVQFVAAASHELRTPLAVIQTSASAILQATSEQAAGFSNTIDSECRHMTRLVDDLLLLARADAETWTLQRQIVDVETLLLNQWDQFEQIAAQKGVSIVVSIDHDEPLAKIQGDEQRLGQVLSVLLDNAIHYTPKGGMIRLNASQSDHLIRITVSDNGPGIPEKALTRVFDRFYRGDQSRSDKEHYGLGLSIAREITALHKGRIHVCNHVGSNGCTFTVELPLNTSEG